MSSNIIIRDDDVLLSSTGHFDDSFGRFKSVHDIICQSSKLIHVPTILTEEIQAFPEAIEYIQFETKSGRMHPELHGLTHIDYGALSKTEVVVRLAKAIDWFERTLGYYPAKWYTPWGANQPHLHEAAKIMKLEAVDCSAAYKLKGRYGVPQLLADGKPLALFDNKEIIIHWWNGLDVERLANFVKVLNEAYTTN